MRKNYLSLDSVVSDTIKICLERFGPKFEFKKLQLQSDRPGITEYSMAVNFHQLTDQYSAILNTFYIEFYCINPNEVKADRFEELEYKAHLHNFDIDLETLFDDLKINEYEPSYIEINIAGKNICNVTEGKYVDLQLKLNPVIDKIKQYTEEIETSAKKIQVSYAKFISFLLMHDCVSIIDMPSSVKCVGSLMLSGSMDIQLSKVLSLHRLACFGISTAMEDAIIDNSTFIKLLYIQCRILVKKLEKEALTLDHKHDNLMLGVKFQKSYNRFTYFNLLEHLDEAMDAINDMLIHEQNIALTLGMQLQIK